MYNKYCKLQNPLIKHVQPQNDGISRGPKKKKEPNRAYCLVKFKKTKGDKINSYQAQRWVKWFSLRGPILCIARFQ